MAPTEVVRALTELPEMAGVPGATIETLAAAGREQRCRARTYVFHQGDPADHVYLLLDGLAEAGTESEAGKRQLHARLEPPRLFGELAVLGGLARTASVLCVEDSRLWAIDGPAFLEAVTSDPPAAAALLGALARHVESSEAYAEDLLWLDLKGRVAKRLLQLACESRDGRVPRLTHADLASFAGGTRENVSRILAELERRGFVRQADRRYEIADPAALERLAGSER